MRKLSDEVIEKVLGKHSIKYIKVLESVKGELSKFEYVQIFGWEEADPNWYREKIRDFAVKIQALEEKVMMSRKGIDIYSLLGEEAKELNSKKQEYQDFYNTSILDFTHLCAMACLIRNGSLIEGLIFAAENDNLNDFLFNSRALVEASGDSIYSLKQIMDELIDNRMFLMGECPYIEIDQLSDLHNQLDHLLYAGSLYEKKLSKGFDRNLRKRVDKILIPEKAKSYINQLESYLTEKCSPSYKGRVVDFYDFLCDCQHPSGYTMTHFFKVEEGKVTWDLDISNFEKIMGVVRDYKDIYEQAIYFSLELPIMTLKILNLFTRTSLHTESVQAILNSRKDWRKIQAKIRGPQ